MEDSIPRHSFEISRHAELTIPGLVEWYVAVNGTQRDDEIAANRATFDEQRDVVESANDAEPSALGVAASSQELGTKVLST